MDDKGRVFVPKRFQALLSPSTSGDPQLVLTRGFEPCVYLFTTQGFQEWTSRLTSHPLAGTKLRKLHRLFFSTVYELKLDGNGRVLVPEPLRAAAGLKDRVAMVGALARAELWDQATWDAYKSQSSSDLAELGDLLEGQLPAIEPEGEGA